LLGNEDRQVYTEKEMIFFGADRGQKLFQALMDAAARGVYLRVLTAKDSLEGIPNLDLPAELKQLKQAYPDKIQVHCWSGKEWYGGGILHQKIWLFDDKVAYIGSANMDWKSLSQVMEIGVLIEYDRTKSAVMEDLRKLFDVWWLWSILPVKTLNFVSQKFQSVLKVPNWSPYLMDRSVKDPFVDTGLMSKYTKEHQLTIQWNNSQAQVFIAAAPLEATVERSRTFDEDALVYTIQSAQEYVYLSVMDFTPFSMYALDIVSSKFSIWWSTLQDVILTAVFAKPNLQIRLLISHWAHTNKEMISSLEILKKQSKLCKKLHPAIKCSSTVEIKFFQVSGWNETTFIPKISKGKWPSFTRVNHAKYILTDQRLNIGTSNMEWSYFYTTAGISVNTNHQAIRKQMKQLFERNWNSNYTIDLVL
jgi:phospholipase D3/4